MTLALADVSRGVAGIDRFEGLQHEGRVGWGHPMGELDRSPGNL